MPVKEELLNQALSLPPVDRIFLVEALEESLGCEQLGAELRRRSSAYRVGKTSARLADDVLADLEQRQANETLQ